MPYSKEREPGIRNYQEAWDMALDHKGMLYGMLYSYVSSHSLPFYKGEALQTELESFAWEAFFDACRKWDETKGYTLSTYAYPAVTNAMNARMKVLSRMGSSMVGAYTKGEKSIRPELSSLEYIDEAFASKVDADANTNSIADTKNHPWQEHEPSLEDTVIDAIANEQLLDKIKEYVALMDEPYQTVFTLCFLTEPTHERSPGGISLGGGLTLKEIGNKYGRSTTWVKEILDEALDFIRFRFNAEAEKGEQE